MRQNNARGIALGTGILIVGASALFGFLKQDELGYAAPGDDSVVGGMGSGQVPDSILVAGRAVYDAQQCSACHSIAGQGSPRGPLDGVGNRLEADEIRLWIVDPQAARPGVRKPAFDDLPEADLEALVVYLGSLEET